MIFKTIFNRIKRGSLILAGLSLGIISSNETLAQIPSQDGTSCANAIPFCSSNQYNFPNINNGAAGPAGPNYGCLGSQPNAVWYYMQIANPGTMQISVAQTNVNGGGIDIDFAMWGPFTSTAAGCAAIMAGQAPLQCSYSGSATETIGIGMPGGTGTGASTPPNAINGQVYIVLFTNFSNQPGNITFSQTAGTATTDCSIIDCGVTIGSNSPVCQGDSVLFTLTNTNEPDYLYNYVWTGPNGFYSTDREPVISGLTAGTHTFNVDAITQLSNGTFDTCTEVIDVLVHPTYQTPVFENICAGDSLLWFDNYYKVGGSYDTLLATVNGCDSLITLHLTVIPRPTEIQMLDSIIACQYDSVALESNALPYSNTYIYNWSPSTNLNITDVPNVWFNADETRRYILTVSNVVNGMACSLKDTVTVIVNPGDFLQVPITDTGICPSDTVQLSASGAAQYRWEPAIYLNDANIANPVARNTTSTQYKLYGISDKNCRDTVDVNVTVYPAATLSLPDYVNIYAGERYFMQPTTNALFFHWFPNSGLNNNSISNPVMYPEVDTRYFVTAKTEFGCEITDSVDFWVKGTVVDMPNAFNPNVETFKPNIRGLMEINDFSIYNRWGQKVFTTKSLEFGWDGKIDGTPQPAGVYVYSIDAVTVEGKTFKKTGNVTLIR